MAPSTSRVLLPQPLTAPQPPLGQSGLPLIWCPYCGMERILELISKTSDHPMKRLFKCPRKYKKFPLCDFYMFEEEYANFLVNYGMLSQSEMCHYHPLEMTDSVQGVQGGLHGHDKALRRNEPAGVYEHGRSAASAQKGFAKKKKQGQFNWMMCVGVAIIVLLGLNFVILLLLVVMQMYK